MRDEAAFRDFAGEKRNREQEAEEHGTKACGERKEARTAAERQRLRDARTVSGDRITPTPTAMALQRDQRDDDGQHHAGDLRRSGQAAAVQPRRKNGDRKGADAEIFARADVVQRLQWGERQADRQRRARQRYSNGAEQLHPPGAEGARHFQHAGALREEHRPGGDVDVRVEHDRHDEDAAGQRAHLRKPIVRARSPAHEAAQGALKWPGCIEDFNVDVGRDVGRNRKRERQQPRERRMSRKPVRRYEPCRADPDRTGKDSHAPEQQARFDERRREDVPHEAPPDGEVAAERNMDKRNERGEREAAHAGHDGHGPERRGAEPARPTDASRSALAPCARRGPRGRASQNRIRPLSAARQRRRKLRARDVGHGAPGAKEEAPRTRADGGQPQRSKPTLSISSLALARRLAISDTGMGSGFSAPNEATSELTGTPGRTGYS